MFERVTEVCGVPRPSRDQYVIGPGKHLDVLVLVGSPGDLCTTFATVGFSRVPWPGSNKTDRAELIAAARSDVDLGPLLAVIVEASVEHGLAPNYGRAFRNSSAHSLTSELATRWPHSVLIPPVPWGNGFAPYAANEWTVNTFHVWPVSEAEMLFLKVQGWDEFERRLEQSGVDLLDMSRAEIV